MCHRACCGFNSRSPPVSETRHAVRASVEVIGMSFVTCLQHSNPVPHPHGWGRWSRSCPSRAPPWRNVLPPSLILSQWRQSDRALAALNHPDEVPWLGLTAMTSTRRAERGVAWHELRCRTERRRSAGEVP